MWAIPKVDRIDLVCCTVPVLGHRKPNASSMLRTRFKGARIDTSEDGGLLLKAEEGMHIEKRWHPTRGSDGTWGWCTDVWTPIPMSFFEKIESRLFEIKGRVWIGTRQVSIEARLEFSVSVLWRELYMM